TATNAPRTILGMLRILDMFSSRTTVASPGPTAEVLAQAVYRLDARPGSDDAVKSSRQIRRRPDDPHGRNFLLFSLSVRKRTALRRGAPLQIRHRALTCSRTPPVERRRVGSAEPTAAESVDDLREFCACGRSGEWCWCCSWVWWLVFSLADSPAVRGRGRKSPSRQ